MRRSLSQTSWIALVVLAGLLAGCDRKPIAAPVAPPTVAPQNPAWSQIISSHTAGIVSRKATIRVVFAGDVIEPSRVGTSADKNFSANPAVTGSATFTSPREVVLSPSKDLEAGRFYRFTVKPTGLLGLSETLAPYEFVAQVQPRQFEVNVAGLNTDAKNEAQSVLRGSLVTADTEAPEQVEKVLTASFLDKPLAIAWQHHADGRNREFTIAGIERQGEAKSVVLKWDGEALGASTKGERTVEVPARNQFKVTQVQPVQAAGEQYIQVYFSDSLDPKQNLRGLVRLGSGASTERIEGNVLKVYPDKGIEGDVSVTLDAGLRNAKGERMAAGSTHTVAFASAKPQVRFVGKGVILPDNPVLSVPFEAVNVRSVHVTALRIFESNVGQFLQVNKLDGQQDLGRVGRYLWRKTIHLTAPQSNRWNRYALDVTELFYIPVDLAEAKSRVIFEAVHRDRNARLHWHFDDTYVGATRTFHQRALDAAAGSHTITVVDAQGNRLSRQLEVLAREAR